MIFRRRGFASGNAIASHGGVTTNKNVGSIAFSDAILWLDGVLDAIAASGKTAKGIRISPVLAPQMELTANFAAPYFYRTVVFAPDERLDVIETIEVEVA